MNAETIVRLMTAVSTFGLGIFIPVWYFVVIEPKQRKSIEEMTKSINTNLKNIENAIEGKKKYLLEDFQKICPKSTEVTIRRIFHEIQKIIKKNNISTKYERIIQDIEIIMGQYMGYGRDFLSKEMGFEKEILDVFFFQTDQIKNDCLDKISNCIRCAAKNLETLEEDKRNLIYIYQKNDSEEKAAFVYSFEEVNRKIKDEYDSLEHSIWQVFEKALIGTKNTIEEK